MRTPRSQVLAREQLLTEGPQQRDLFERLVSSPVKGGCKVNGEGHKVRSSTYWLQLSNCRDKGAATAAQQLSIRRRDL